MYQLEVFETKGFDRSNEFIQIGIPLPTAFAFSIDRLELVSDTNSTVSYSLKAQSLWHDNSIKWVLIQTYITLIKDTSVKLQLQLKKTVECKVSNKENCVAESKNQLSIKTKKAVFLIHKNKFNLFDSIQFNDKKISSLGSCQLKLKDQSLSAKVNSIEHHSSYSNDRTLITELKIKSSFYMSGEKPVANLLSNLTFHHLTDTVTCQLTLHNPRAAKHHDGQWDLGDQNSLLFSGFNCTQTISSDENKLYTVDKAQSIFESFENSVSIYQESSGGANWNSNNHLNRKQEMPLTFKGYRLKVDDSKVSGDRASPSLNIGDGDYISAKIHQFWEMFPNELSYNSKQLDVNLFPSACPDLHELQPGEKASKTFTISLNEKPNSLAYIDSPLELKINPKWIEKCAVFQYFSSSPQVNEIQKLINQGLNHEKNFFQKREEIDEFGWRNFGDIYADHEKIDVKSQDVFVSHYNNQYDPIYGFLHQYCLSGDNRWLNLANDLAQHVANIDIYHTENDKAEYNGGLFWHTDHYCEAQTASHRTYSKHQSANVYDDHAGGGGPGGQHCYSLGLMYHYYLTGSESSKNAVFKLSHWITNYYEGSGTFLEAAFAVKNKSRIDLKNILTNTYPLDRGTANYINSLLDLFDISNNNALLKHIEHIIQHTVHPKDNLENRELKNVEKSWFYIIFLQSLCRYLNIKDEFKQYDDAFHYSKDCLLHYANWMVEHEYCYLDKPEILEFPNHTWTAQDVRKINVLICAAKYNNNNAYLKKAELLKESIISKLQNESSTTQTRILVLLMQNYLPEDITHPKLVFPEGTTQYKPQKQTYMSSTLNILDEMTIATKAFSLRKEINWLAKRSEKIAAILGHKND